MYSDFITDMAIESAENNNMADSSKSEDVGFDIVKRFFNIKTKDMASRIGKPDRKSVV